MTQKDTKEYKTFKVINHKGEEKNVRVGKLMYSLFKIVRPHLGDNPDKAIMILNSNIVHEEDRKLILDIIDSDDLTAMLSLEDMFAQVLSPTMEELKKK